MPKIGSKQPRITIRPTTRGETARAPKCCSNDLLKKAGQLSEHSEKRLKHVFESILSVETRDGRRNDHVLLLTEKFEAHKALLESIFSAPNAFEIDEQTMQLILKLLAEMMATPYEVIVSNGTSDDVSNLTIVYFQNSLVGSKIVTSGPFSKSLQTLPPGETAGFQLCPCLYMVDKYAIQFDFDGNSYSLNQDIPSLNAEEQATFGSIDYCGDTLQIAIE